MVESLIFIGARAEAGEEKKNLETVKIELLCNTGWKEQKNTGIIENFFALSRMELEPQVRPS